MQSDVPYCSGCDAPSLPNTQGICPWCDTDLSDQLDALTAVFEDNNNAVLVASTFTAQVFEAAKTRRRILWQRRQTIMEGKKDA